MCVWGYNTLPGALVVLNRLVGDRVGCIIWNKVYFALKVVRYTFSLGGHKKLLKLYYLLKWSVHDIRIIEFLRPICEVVRKGMSFHYTNPFLSYCVLNVILSKNMYKGPLSVAWQAFVVSHVAPSGVKITYLILLLRSSRVTHSLLCNIDYVSSLANIKHE